MEPFVILNFCDYFQNYLQKFHHRLSPKAVGIIFFIFFAYFLIFIIIFRAGKYRGFGSRNIIFRTALI